MKLFETVMKPYFASILTSEESPPAISPTFDDELNALRYVSGYMLYKLLRKYEHCSTPCLKAPLYVGCVAVAGDDSDVRNYTIK